MGQQAWICAFPAAPCCVFAAVGLCWAGPCGRLTQGSPYIGGCLAPRTRHPCHPCRQTGGKAGAWPCHP